MKVRLLLVDDHPIVRSGMRMLFQAEPDLEIVGEADGGAEAIVAVQRLHPDVVIMDVAMPGVNGIEATRRIKELAPETAVLALTMHEDEQYFFEMLKAGASGYIPKRAAPDDLVAAVRVVAQGNVFLYATLARFLMKDVGEPGAGEHVGAEAAGDAGADDLLTAREREVLACIADGMTSREIAEKLVISVKTVERHRENIMAKLDIHNRVELVKYAMRKGIIVG
jgi:two-component system response regulator NreC